MRSSLHRRMLLAAALCTVLLAACDAAEEQPSEPPSNVLLISIDTLRADHLGCYGYERPTSPAVDALAADSVLFRQAIAQAPSTLHSHASMLSSLLPQHHRASRDADTRLPEEALTLAEVLRAAGYRTGAFTGGGQMARIYGLDQGFELYEEPKKELFAGTVQVALPWIDEHADERFFLFLHSYEVHHPYSPPDEYRQLLGIDYDGPLPSQVDKDLLERINGEEPVLDIDDADLDYIVSLYDAEIRSMDDGLATLIGALKARGLYDQTLIVFTSDHGEEFDEHGRVGWHSHSLYDELLHVPLIVKLPEGRRAGTTIDAQVRSIDIAPTVLAALGYPLPKEFSGADLAPLIDGGEMAPLVAISRQDRGPRREISSIRTERWKLSGLARRRALFDLDVDPAEQWDRALQQPDVVSYLERRLDEIIASREPFDPPRVELPEETLEELRALGYIN